MKSQKREPFTTETIGAKGSWNEFRTMGSSIWNMVKSSREIDYFRFETGCPDHRDLLVKAKPLHRLGMIYKDAAWDFVMHEDKIVITIHDDIRVKFTLKQVKYTSRNAVPTVYTAKLNGIDLHPSIERVTPFWELPATAPAAVENEPEPMETAVSEPVAVAAEIKPEPDKIKPTKKRRRRQVAVVDDYRWLFGRKNQFDAYAVFKHAYGF